MKMMKKRSAEVEAELIVVADAKRKADFLNAKQALGEAERRVRRSHYEWQDAQGCRDDAQTAYKRALRDYSTINCGIPAADLSDCE